MARYSTEPEDPSKGKCVRRISGWMDGWIEGTSGWACGAEASGALCPRRGGTRTTHIRQYDSSRHVRFSHNVTLSPNQPVAKARGSHLRVHFKHVREVVHTINGWPVAKAKQFLEDVLQYKRAVPFTRCVNGLV